MKKDTRSDGYNRWPFKPQSPSLSGDVNNGGIDLVEHPELIDKVHEATEANGLRPLLIQLNGADSPFKTLGCLYGPGEGDEHHDRIYSYIELTFRDQVRARDMAEIDALEDNWIEWLKGFESTHPGISTGMPQNIQWDYRQFSYVGSAPQMLATIWSRAGSEQAHRDLLSWLAVYFDRCYMSGRTS